jgi:hypothetical protein
MPKISKVAKVLKKLGVPPAIRRALIQEVPIIGQLDPAESPATTEDRIIYDRGLRRCSRRSYPFQGEGRAFQRSAL